MSTDLSKLTIPKLKSLLHELQDEIVMGTHPKQFWIEKVEAAQAAQTAKAAAQARKSSTPSKAASVSSQSVSLPSPAVSGVSAWEKPFSPPSERKQLPPSKRKSSGGPNSFQTDDQGDNAMPSDDTDAVLPNKSARTSVRGRSAEKAVRKSTGRKSAGRKSNVHFAEADNDTAMESDSKNTENNSNNRPSGNWSTAYPGEGNAFISSSSSSSAKNKRSSSAQQDEPVEVENEPKFRLSIGDRVTAPQDDVEDDSEQFDDDSHHNNNNSINTQYASPSPNPTARFSSNYVRSPVPAIDDSELRRRVSSSNRFSLQPSASNINSALLSPSKSPPIDPVVLARSQLNLRHATPLFSPEQTMEYRERKRIERENEKAKEQTSNTLTPMNNTQPEQTMQSAVQPAQTPSPSPVSAPPAKQTSRVSSRSPSPSRSAASSSPSSATSSSNEIIRRPVSIQETLHNLWLLFLKCLSVLMILVGLILVFSPDTILEQIRIYRQIPIFLSPEEYSRMIESGVPTVRPVAPCPPNGVCSPLGELSCMNGYELSSSGRECVETNTLTAATQYYTREIVSQLNTLAGRYECGELDLLPSDLNRLPPFTTRAQLRTQLQDEIIRHYPNPTEVPMDLFWIRVFKAIEANKQIETVHPNPTDNTPNDEIAYYSLNPSYSYSCMLKLYVAQHKLHVFLYTLAIGFLFYFYMLYRATKKLNALSTNIYTEIRRLLSQSPSVSFAIVHLRDELYDAGVNTRDEKIWTKAVELINNDSRIVCSREMKTNVTRDCWTWMGAHTNANTSNNSSNDYNQQFRNENQRHSNAFSAPSNFT